MTDYLCHFDAGLGVMWRTTMTLNSKHYSETSLRVACEDLATRLGFTFMYFEEIPA